MEFEWTDAMATKTDAAKLSAMLSAVSSQTDRVNVAIGADGSVTVRAVSPDHVTMVGIDAEAGTVMGICSPVSFEADVNAWLAFLRRCKGDVAMLWLGSSAVQLRCRGVSAVLRLDPPGPDVRIPSLSLEDQCVFDPAVLKDMAALVPKSSVAYWRMSLTPSGLNVSVRDDTGTGPGAELAAGDMDLCDVPSGQAEASFPRERWTDVLKALPSGAIGLELGNDYPCRVTFGGVGWSGQWMCAPIIESRR